MSAEAGATIDSKQLGAADVSTTSADSRAKEMAATASATNSSSSILSDMKKVFHDTKVDGKSVWTVSMETLTMADGGKWKKNDRSLLFVVRKPLPDLCLDFLADFFFFFACAQLVGGDRDT